MSLQCLRVLEIQRLMQFSPPARSTLTFQHESSWKPVIECEKMEQFGKTLWMRLELGAIGRPNTSGRGNHFCEMDMQTARLNV